MGLFKSNDTTLSSILEKINTGKYSCQIFKEDGFGMTILIPMASAADLSTALSELFAKFQISFYQSAEDAVFKALGVE